MGCGGALICSCRETEAEVLRAKGPAEQQNSLKPSLGHKAKLAQKEPSEPAVLAFRYPTATRSNGRLQSLPLRKFTSELILL